MRLFRRLFERHDPPADLPLPTDDQLTEALNRVQELAMRPAGDIEALARVVMALARGRLQATNEEGRWVVRNDTRLLAQQDEELAQAAAAVRRQFVEAMRTAVAGGATRGAAGERPKGAGEQ